MKIFFCKSPKKFSLRAKEAFVVLLVILISTLSVSQLYFFLSQGSVPASNQSIAVTDLHSLILTSDNPIDKKDAVILIDGEEKYDLSDTSAEIAVNKTCVVEVMSLSEEPFYIHLSSSDNLKLFPQTQKVLCKKGINYICRCYCYENE